MVEARPHSFGSLRRLEGDHRCASSEPIRKSFFVNMYYSQCDCWSVCIHRPLPTALRRILRRRPNFSVSGAVQYQSDRPAAAHGYNQRPAPTAALNVYQHYCKLCCISPTTSRLLYAQQRLNNVGAHAPRQRGDRSTEEIAGRDAYRARTKRRVGRSVGLPDPRVVSSVACMPVARAASHTMSARRGAFVLRQPSLSAQCISTHCETTTTA